ncbi:Transmembrane 9 super member 2, variant 2 [Entomophthora muscae]|nr:Transmembrane 9 super member 2, variant 2 [Entomophthora muscae]
MVTSKHRACLWVLLGQITLIPQAQGFYIPGLAPVSYQQNATVPLTVNVLSPFVKSSQRVQSVLTYDFYDKRFHFCQPKTIVRQDENLGAMLFGDRIQNSAFTLEMAKNASCAKLCDAKIPSNDAKFINDLISESYGLDWQIDGLPVKHKDEDKENDLHSVGFPLGIDRNGIPLFHNHYDITIEYNQHDKLFQVLGAIVTPSSKNSLQNNKFNCDTTDTLSLKDAASNEVAFSYSVTWIPNTGNWATRWDVFLTIQNPSFHWYSLAYSIGIVLVLTGVLAAILFRILNRDIARYNQIDLQDDIQEDFGWKLVHGDVFRPPTHLMLLSVLTGSGLQLFGMLFTTLAFAGLGFFSPSYRGSFVTALVVLFMLFGVVSGFTSARLYKMFGGDNWKSNIIITATLVPGTLFTIFIVINFFLVATSSSASVPFGTIFSMILLWFLLSTPLSFVGSYYGLKKSKITHPVRTNQIPRQVPDQPLSMHPFASVMMAGILPFAAIYNELSFIMDSLWFHQIYYLFGFLFVIFLEFGFYLLGVDYSSLLLASLLRKLPLVVALFLCRRLNIHLHFLVLNSLLLQPPRSQVYLHHHLFWVEFHHFPALLLDYR